jgi:hypothetical protein
MPRKKKEPDNFSEFCLKASIEMIKDPEPKVAMRAIKGLRVWVQSFTLEGRLKVLESLPIEDIMKAIRRAIEESESLEAARAANEGVLFAIVRRKIDEYEEAKRIKLEKLDKKPVALKIKAVW